MKRALRFLSILVWLITLVIACITVSHFTDGEPVVSVAGVIVTLLVGYIAYQLWPKPEPKEKPASFFAETF